MKRMNLDRFLKKGKGFVLAFSCLLMFLFIGIQEAGAQNFDGTPTLPNNFVSESVALNVMQTQIGVLKTQLQSAHKNDVETLNAQVDTYNMVLEDLSQGQSVEEAYVRVTNLRGGPFFYLKADATAATAGQADYAKIFTDLTAALTQ